MEINDEKDVFVVYEHVRETEEIWYDIPRHFCNLEATALRLAKGKYINGSDAPVCKEKAYKIGNKWFACVKFKAPTHEDVEIQAAIDKRKQLVEKAIAAGLTEEDIKMLSEKE